MLENILDKIEKNDRKNTKYFRSLETASEIALNVIAFANSGGGYIVFGVKDNYAYLEPKGIGNDYEVKKILSELNTYFHETIYETTMLENEGKILLVIKVYGIKRRKKHKGRIYIMDSQMKPAVVKEKVFISHASQDKQYGEALVKFLRGIGLKRDQIIFTSDDDYGIPIGMNIFDYLKSQIDEGAYMIYLLSNNYYDSVACLNEMGAAWVVQNEYAVVGVPDFEFSNPKFSSGAIDPRAIGFKLDNKKRLVEFKNQLVTRFELTIDEADWNRLLDEHIESL
ncbi:RNA-binding domain-containing protein [Paenibacillus sp. NPDC056722]|uniref:RNA-binding domain-containing protein n=1 Tax=Paenibacillus sp. NPDC056722 TaxID=3345924 RepID=UPI003690B6BE